MLTAQTGRTHGCTDQPAGVKKVLANPEPSTHGTSRTSGLSPFGAVFDADAEEGLGRIAVNKIAAQISDPEAWIKESAELAKQFAYAPPVSTGTNAVLLTREYETNARNIARSQAALAAARLANLINNALK